VAACAFEENAEAIQVSEEDIPESLLGLDIGPKTQKLYGEILQKSNTVLWNGPMGVFEWKNFSAGTMFIANEISQLSQAFTVVGGGDSVAALNASGKTTSISHVSTGGGASLEYLEGLTLPGLAVLDMPK
jgi:phosphoglycerate kinase